MKETAVEESMLNGIWPVLIVMGVAFAMVVIVYGVDSVLPGAHDTFHDFRHVIGIPCH